jgi:hypothetical protein
MVHRRILDFAHFSQLDNQSKVVLNSDKKRECAGLCARKRDAGLPTLTLANESNQSFCEKTPCVYSLKAFDCIPDM